MSPVDKIVQGLSSYVQKLNKLNEQLNKEHLTATAEANKFLAVAETNKTEAIRAKAIADNIQNLLSVPKKETA
jgi:hypothetical protein